ncbi:hypothetical protein KCP75_04600 [Salmonella enterica subsp. enterica]|nr:hypothetical protein KCP75_04600 [Salmonella enterica subsp. enterica]
MCCRSPSSGEPRKRGAFRRFIITLGLYFIIDHFSRSAMAGISSFYRNGHGVAIQSARRGAVKMREVALVFQPRSWKLPTYQLASKTINAAEKYAALQYRGRRMVFHRKTLDAARFQFACAAIKSWIPFCRPAPART